MPSLLQPVDHSGHTVDSGLAAFAIPIMLDKLRSICVAICVDAGTNVSMR